MLPVMDWGGDSCWVAGQGQGVLWGPAAGCCDGESCPHAAARLWASPGAEETPPRHPVPCDSIPSGPHPAPGTKHPPECPILLWDTAPFPDPPLPLCWCCGAALSSGSRSPSHSPKGRDGGSPLPPAPLPCSHEAGGALAAAKERTGGGRNGPFPLRGKRGDFQPKHPGTQQPHTFPASLPSFIPEDIGDQTQVGPISCSCSEVIELCL